MTAESELIKYGYAALALGTFLEGETILVVAGFLASRGYLSISLVILAAFAGTVFGDQLYFQIGRQGGTRIIRRFPFLAGKVARVTSILENHSIKVILLFRFFYGLRAVSPFAIGMSRIPAVRFFILNLISATIWSVAVAFAGFFFGKGVAIIFSDIKHHELELVLVIAGAGLAVFAWFYLRKKRHKKRQRSKKQKH